MKVDMEFEVAIVPVSDVDRAKAFYTELGWRADDDIVNGADFRAVQLTPPGSAASVTFGKGVTDARPGSFRGGLIVSDIVAAHNQIVASGIEATEVFHGSPFSPEARISGPDPERKSYSSYVAFQDPDGNAWVVQEVTMRRRDASCRGKRRQETTFVSPPLTGGEAVVERTDGTV